MLVILTQGLQAKFGRILTQGLRANTKSNPMWAVHGGSRAYAFLFPLFSSGSEVSFTHTVPMPVRMGAMEYNIVKFREKTDYF